ncbi:hypothetical protein CALVIDRAFT_567471 [Calocera viscosa TUFC12733]|uniref:Putative Zn2Cys6 domain-containing protein n=1 Tax=Calocera viscosa (strain TUFC12733) TaxID=1330018 RepID=A0A167I9J0_CALVF|nr:hypothetical protein CALVIDRAFT_567471 [Calocera viscosa TUFC12733]
MTEAVQTRSPVYLRNPDYSSSRFTYGILTHCDKRNSIARSAKEEQVDRWTKHIVHRVTGALSSRHEAGASYTVEVAEPLVALLQFAYNWRLHSPCPEGPLVNEWVPTAFWEQLNIRIGRTVVQKPQGTLTRARLTSTESHPMSPAEMIKRYMTQLKGHLSTALPESAEAEGEEEEEDVQGNKYSPLQDDDESCAPSRASNVDWRRVRHAQQPSVPWVMWAEGRYIDIDLEIDLLAQQRDLWEYHNELWLLIHAKALNTSLAYSAKDPRPSKRGGESAAASRPITYNWCLHSPSPEWPFFNKWVPRAFSEQLSIRIQGKVSHKPKAVLTHARLTSTESHPMSPAEMIKRYMTQLKGHLSTALPESAEAEDEEAGEEDKGSKMVHSYEANTTGPGCYAPYELRPAFWLIPEFDLEHFPSIDVVREKGEVRIRDPTLSADIINDHPDEVQYLKQLLDMLPHLKLLLDEFNIPKQHCTTRYHLRSVSSQANSLAVVFIVDSLSSSKDSWMTDGWREACNQPSHLQYLKRLLHKLDKLWHLKLL